MKPVHIVVDENRLSVIGSVTEDPADIESLTVFWYDSRARKKCFSRTLRPPGHVLMMTFRELS